MTTTLKTGRSPSDPEAVIAIYDAHTDVDAAVKELQKGGFDMTKLSVVGKDYHTDEQVVGYYNAGDRMRYWGKIGAIWGGLWALLFGAAFFWIPGVGPLLIAGPLAAAFVAALESAVLVGGLSALGAALHSIGIPKDSILKYETAIKANKYLLVAQGTATEVARAKEILKTTKPTELDEHVSGEPGPALAGGWKNRENKSTDQRWINTAIDRMVEWSIVLSVLMIVAGGLAIIAPPVLDVAVAGFVGWLMAGTGAAHLLYSWHTRGGGGLLWGILLGIIYIVAGGYLLLHPMTGLASLTIVLAVCLLLESILEFILSFQLRPIRGSRWLLVEGIINLILALMIWRTWPVSSMWGIGTLVGISMVFGGFTRLMISAAARDVANAFRGELHQPKQRH